MNSIHSARMIGLANSSVDVYTFSFSGYYPSSLFKRPSLEIIQMRNIIKHINRK